MDNKDEQIIALKRELYSTKLLQALGIAIQTNQDIRPIVEGFADNCARVEYERDLLLDWKNNNKILIDLLTEGFPSESAPQFAEFEPSERWALAEKVRKGRVSMVIYRYLGENNATVRNLTADFPGDDDEFEAALSEIAAIVFGAPTEADITRTFPGIKFDAFKIALRELAFYRYHMSTDQFREKRLDMFNKFWPDIEKTGHYKKSPSRDGKASTSAREKAKKDFFDKIEAIFENNDQHFKANR